MRGKNKKHRMGRMMSGDRSSSSSDYRKDKKRPKGVGKFLRIRLGGRTQIGEGRRKRHDLESCMCLLPALCEVREKSSEGNER